VLAKSVVFSTWLGDKMSTETIEQQTQQETKLVANDVYLKAGIHVGTKFKTKHMQSFIYKTRPDGLAVLDVQAIDRQLDYAFKLLANYKEEEILVVCRRENGWKPLHLLKQATKIRGYSGRYPPGILTNSNLENFIEAKIMVVVDPWADKNAIEDALKMGIVVIALCDTNNQCNNIDLVVPCNNKGRKSLGLFFYLFMREYLKAKGKTEEEMPYKMDDFMEE
jgi:small subunit ribosomal protein S2